MATSASNLRNSGDRVVRTIGKLIAKAWFRSIETEGTDRISMDRPVLICANHANGFVDPVLIVATSPRPVRFLAKSTLWKVKPVGAILNLAGVLPVYRQQDGGTDRNVNTFAACDAELAADGAIGLFPEGTVNDTLKLLPLHTGAARIALGARAAGAEALRIVPVGLLYEDKAAPRTRVLVRVGEPIDIDDAWDEIAAPGDSDGSDNRAVVEMAARVALRSPGADPSHLVPMSRVEPVARRLAALPPAQLEPVLEATAAYTSQLDLLGLSDRDVVPGNTLPRLRMRLNRSATLIVVLAVPAAIGAGVNLPPYVLVRLVSRRPTTRVSRANLLMLASMVAYPATWVGWALLARRRLRHPWRAALVAGPLCGYATVACYEQIDRVRRAKLQWRRVTRSSGDVLDALREQRAAVVAAVAEALGAPARSISSSVVQGPWPTPTAQPAPP
jgi:glycerol-3-phosphate O-acyltransferase / dihydroxyacetone phosphate acyltransferase